MKEMIKKRRTLWVRRFLLPKFLQECFELWSSNLAVLVWLQLIKFDIHDADALQSLNLVAEGGTHATNLVLLALSQDNCKFFLIRLARSDLSWFGTVAFNVDAV